MSLQISNVGALGLHDHGNRLSQVVFKGLYFSPKVVPFAYYFITLLYTWQFEDLSQREYYELSAGGIRG